MASKKATDLLSKLRALDAYPKVNEDFFTKTMSGGIITVVASIVMALLFLNELRLYLSVNSVHELSVDTSRGETIQINVDVTLPRIPCSWLSLDAMDISGELHLDVDHDVYKQRLSSTGQPIYQAEKHNVAATKKPEVPAGNDTTGCGSCYGAEDADQPCCNTCDEVRAQYRKRGWALSNVDNVEQCAHDAYLEALKEQTGEGCRMWGHLVVNKVAGNFHFAPGRSYQQGNMHVHDLAPFASAALDFTHTINALSFGRPYPGMKNPLDGVVVRQEPPGGSSGMYQYFMKVVPTVYHQLNGSLIHSNQFSVTENYRENGPMAGRMLPGVFFFYDLSPIKVKIVEHKNSGLHFLTNVCAIVGGIFTVSGLIDAFVYHSDKLIRKKMELGKFS